ncbi:hypothetical protein IEQ34_012911 [Dendrobium chrysotoxum]|uniref:Uncharacterized protein n=1 Tax=Dendrobium chrysotoxum TaxID=161865 RepID=A0AAV7GN66_DENCH|nr:hypothetical protein IEQ34_012911 [Dendrobium chrysotoxum]
MTESSLFPCNESWFILLKYPISAGIGPEKRLLLRSIFTKLAAFEISGGSPPENLLFCKNSADKFLAFPIYFVKLP